jgi:hypothetical protein
MQSSNIMQKFRRNINSYKMQQKKRNQHVELSTVVRVSTVHIEPKPGTVHLMISLSLFCILYKFFASQLFHDMSYPFIFLLKYFEH